jgi:hypothetical protein
LSLVHPRQQPVVELRSAGQDQPPTCGSEQHRAEAPRSREGAHCLLGGHDLSVAGASRGQLSEYGESIKERDVSGVERTRGKGSQLSESAFFECSGRRRTDGSQSVRKLLF